MQFLALAAFSERDPQAWKIHTQNKLVSSLRGDGGFGAFLFDSDMGC